jgi:hypothetical protein
MGNESSRHIEVSLFGLIIRPEVTKDEILPEDE